MSWLAKVSDFAGRAEDLLNQIDQSAAVALKKPKKKPTGRSDSAVTLINIEEENAAHPGKAHSEIVENSAVRHHIR
ncbi:unnamed protein product [Gongylonema pulchrum]|uniref:Golgin family A protein n=1 Tax=Gongylonema pulchrum TaxID=637853 RepID=A0A183DTW5_9BILA|nr:unnamed protein product [Gongylonema pulchrum]